MSKETTVILLGLLVAITPYLGIPGFWKTVVLVLAGLGIAGTGFLLRGEVIGRGHAGDVPRRGEHGREKTFVENFMQGPRAHRDHGIGPLN